MLFGNWDLSFAKYKFKNANLREKKNYIKNRFQARKKYRIPGPKTVSPKQSNFKINIYCNVCSQFVYSSYHNIQVY